MDEPTWHLVETREWVRLHGLMADLAYFETLYRHSKYDQLMYLSAVEAKTDLTKVAANQEVADNPLGVYLRVLPWLGILFKSSGYFSESLKLHQEREHICCELGTLTDCSEL